MPMMSQWACESAGVLQRASPPNPCLDIARALAAAGGQRALHCCGFRDPALSLCMVMFKPKTHCCVERCSGLSYRGSLCGVCQRVFKVWKNRNLCGRNDVRMAVGIGLEDHQCVCV